MSHEWWACNCCQAEEPDTDIYGYGPYGLYGYGGYYGEEPHGPCDCCGRDQVVVMFGAATNDPPQPRQNVAACPPCASPSLPFWTDLTGRSATLYLCHEECFEDGSDTNVKIYHGCATFTNVRFRSTKKVGASDCPDVRGTLFIYLVVNCKRFTDGRRGVSLHAVSWNGWPGSDPSCKVYPNCASMGEACTSDLFTDPAQYSNTHTGTLTSGETILAALTTSCGGSVGVSAVPAVNQYGISSATVVF